MEPGERDPLMPHAEDNNDDDDRANAAQKLQPEASSTHVPSGEQTEMTTMKRPPKRGPRIADNSFIEEIEIDKVENEFPNLDKSTLKVRYRLSKRVVWGRGYHRG